MGKRKERRLAALSNAGRRVKLDLFAEPSGELGGSTLNDDVGKDINSEHRDGLPKSPSSSDQQLENPLLLLGQYSDEELDEGSSKRLNEAGVQSLMLNDEGKGSLDEESEDLDVDGSGDHDSRKDKQLGMMQSSKLLDVEGCEKNESVVATGDLQQMVAKDRISVNETSDERVLTDASFGWKMVMHEESKRYYYWNTETGETSWEVPQVLAQAAEFTNDPTTLAAVDDKRQSAAVDVDNSNMASAVMHDSSAAYPIDASQGAAVVSHGEVYGHGSQMDGWNGEYRNEFFQEENRVSDINGSLTAQYDGDHSFISEANVEGQQLGVDFPCNLVKQTENLLERLKSLEKSRGNLQGLDRLSKYILEIEIRLFDFKSLSTYGSSLLPFWVHSDRQIKRLESVINDEMLQTANSALDEGEDKHILSSARLGGQLKGLGNESEVNGNENKGSYSTSDNPNGSGVDTTKDICDQTSANAENISSSISPGNHAEARAGVDRQANVRITPEESPHKHGFHVGEDVDMDVDMEVEDMNSSGNPTVVDVSIAKDLMQTDQPVQLNQPADYCSGLPEDSFVVPPPPEDEWVPPPPPDNEPVPPPPPDSEPMPPPPPDDDPSKLSYPTLPSYPVTGQPIPFTEYNLSFPGASSEYYGHTAPEVASSNVYGNAEGCQIAMPAAQLYYTADPSTYSESSQVINNPVEHVAYYDLQNGTSSMSTQDTNINVTGVVGGGDRALDDVSSTSATMQATAPVSAEQDVSLPTNAAGSAASSSVAKVPTKVVRSKKRAVTVGSLKSNKKVSSLVDKWKAAKEELLEEEEEPESAYEILERKRQREIEEWRAKQIASGEAKDNANFQPLGGDWREKVKRKRAQAASEAADLPQNAVEQNQQPNLVELCKGLPSGWQAYWDESTKKVYYGNVITSETRWTRPTK